MKDKVSISFAEWKKRSTDQYINAICKPCWELKYCPYGVLVENFEIRDELDDPYRCRVFGHLCPVLLFESGLLPGFLWAFRRFSKSLTTKVIFDENVKFFRILLKW